ncbi:MAG: phosphoribosyltransferase [Acidobacteria bacterium]|nr:MAG: phosphoribosyltransferase [Acidobacteriota bacterium]REK04171.1 MAG: phosphoribosyltransferase [Acidobacteriota bacterium]REK15333.1 MAG: phosphoribosyltransferase [Acidobacteriota bacterium]REK46423.1 MAG: phosphoribosyltransferase [Acidobacteriota bacterium]
MHHRFANRREAGKQLASKLRSFDQRPDTIVLALPRGGVPVAYEIARILSIPLDIQVVRKLGVPGQRELAFGAISTGGVAVFNEKVLDQLNLDSESIESVRRKESDELTRRETAYRKGIPKPDLSGKRVILADDGLATGATMRAAVESVRRRSPRSIVVAAPVASPGICKTLNKEPDVECVCLVLPEPLYGVGWWYEDFEQTTDEKVCELLSKLRPNAAVNGD